MAHINASELRARFGGSYGLTLLERYRLDRLRREREAADPRYVTRCAWCESTAPVEAHVVYTHTCCDACRERVEREG